MSFYLCLKPYLCFIFLMMLFSSHNCCVPNCILLRYLLKNDSVFLQLLLLQNLPSYTHCVLAVVSYQAVSRTVTSVVVCQNSWSYPEMYPVSVYT